LVWTRSIKTLPTEIGVGRMSWESIIIEKIHQIRMNKINPYKNFILDRNPRQELVECLLDKVHASFLKSCELHFYIH
jgi:hypothetical protein